MKDLNITAAASALINTGRIRTLSGSIVKYDETTRTYKAVTVRGLRHIVRQYYPYESGSVITDIMQEIFALFENGMYDINTSNIHVSFNNGILNYITGQFYTNRSEVKDDIHVHIPWDYDTSLESTQAVSALESWANGDQDTYNQFLEFLGYCLCGNPVLKKFFILVGNSDSGKSTFLRLLQVLVGKGNYSAAPMHMLDKRFMFAQMQGKMVNIDAEMSSVRIGEDAASMIRALVACDARDIEEKCEPIYSARLPIVLVGACNELPSLDDRYKAMLNRLIPIKFNGSFPSDNCSTSFETTITKDFEAMSYIVTHAFMELKGVFERKMFTLSTDSESLLESFKSRNNPELGYIDECGYDHFYMARTIDAYEEFKLFCEFNGYSSISQQKFNDSVCARYSLKTMRKTINGMKVTSFDKD